MQNGNLGRLLNEAMNLEGRYEWLQAAEVYETIYSSALRDTDFLKSAELQDKIGFCFFRAAMQADTKVQFRSRIKSAIQSYQKAVPLFEKSGEQGGTRAENSMAMIAYVNSWLQVDVSKKRAFLAEWWNLKSKVLSAYEKAGEQIAAAKTINDMLEDSVDSRYWLGSDWKDSVNMREELISLGERSIANLSGSDYDSELARAYCWTSWYCLFDNSSMILGGRKEEVQKGVRYSKIALELSQRIGNAWLVGWSLSSLSLGADKTGDLESAVKFLIQQVEQGEICRDNFLMGFGRSQLVLYGFLYGLHVEDPEKTREMHKNALKIAQKVSHHYQIINVSILNSDYFACIAFTGLSSIELELKKKIALLEKAVEYGRNGVKMAIRWNGSLAIGMLNIFSWALYDLSKIETDQFKKRQLLKEIVYNTKRNTRILHTFAPHNHYMKAYTQNWLALAKCDLSKLTENKQKKVALLRDSLAAMEVCMEFAEQLLEEAKQQWLSKRFGSLYYWFAGIYFQLYTLTKKERHVRRAIAIYEEAIVLYEKADFVPGVAESRWQIARDLDVIGEQLKAAKNYELARREYLKAAEKIPQLSDFYTNHSTYMLAWNAIEQAKHYHSIEEYNKAQEFYQKASKVHAMTEFWSYLAPNYTAWATLEEAEFLSRNENAQQSKEKFQKALEEFSRIESSLGQKIRETASTDEREMIDKLLKASELRRKYCQARILMEEAKLLDREGEYRQSSKSYAEAAENISAIIDRVDVVVEHKELEYLAILCEAWEKMAVAEETASSESYLEAAVIFEEAKEYCYTKKASLWALGNSSFCKGLAAKSKFQSTFDKSYHSMANKHVEQAADYYRRAGFEAASEYAKATQRMLNAYVYMNSAQEEVDPEKKTKYYQLAEQLLQIAAGLFVKAKQPEKTALMQSILATVREEKALAASLNEVMHAPVITSSTMSFRAPSPTSEASVGLEQFQHANVQANLVAGLKEVKVGESFYLTVEFVNAGKEPALLTRVEDFVPPDFTVVEKPEIYRLEESCLNMKGKQIAPLKLVEAKLVLQPSKKGIYHLKPTVHYLDELGQNKSLQLKSVEIKVEEVILSDRISTGTKELDSLLLGGIPKEYAIVLTGPPTDERELIIRNFLEAGTEQGQTSFCVATEADGVMNLLEKSDFHLFLCNPKPKVVVPDLPNVIKLRSKTDINNLNMALARESRNLQTQQNPKRLCIDIVSDVLLEFGATTARKWVSEMLTDLGSKGFTILAVLDSSIHPVDHANAIINLFDGEISTTQSGDPQECKKSIQVKKLRGQDYIKNPICLTKHIKKEKREGRAGDIATSEQK